MTNRASFLCGNRDGHHNTELETQRHIIGQHKKLKREATYICDNCISIRM